MTKKIIIANWKEYIEDMARAREILELIDGQTADRSKIDIIVCPALSLAHEVSKIISPEISLGLQDMPAELSDELNDVRYVIVGHSHQRWDLGESDELTNQKLKFALERNLVPIVCLGEKTRDENFKDFLKQQVESTFAGISSDNISKCIIAYEPVWAISAYENAKPDTPESALESIQVIKDLVSADKYLYGGSITPANAGDFLNRPEIDGVLVGKASTVKESFAEILNSVK